MAYRKKYKALILKYKAHILKYMPCIFYDKPYVFFGVRKIVFLWRIFCVFLALHFSFLMILMFSFRPDAQFLLLHAL